MELWIRSQNKHSLTKIKSVYVSDDDNNCEDVMGLYSTGHIFLGRYKSKERALEIIDEIQNIIKPVLFLRKGNEENILLGARTKGATSILKGDFKMLPTYVYEMPKE